jgi:hypothetical protein
VTKAAIAVIDDNAILAAATSAGEQARQEEGRTAETVQPFGARRFEIVLAEALDRVSRGQADEATLFKYLRFAGVQIVTLAEGAGPAGTCQAPPRIAVRGQVLDRRCA